MSILREIDHRRICRCGHGWRSHPNSLKCQRRRCACEKYQPEDKEVNWDEV